MIRYMTSAALAVSMLAVSAASAQSYDSTQGYRSAQGYGSAQDNRSDFWRGAPTDAWQRIDYLQHRIDRGVSDGSLSSREARRAQMELQQIRRDAMRMRRGGANLSNGNSALLQSRLDRLSQNLRWARNVGSNGYGNNSYDADGHGRYRDRTQDYADQRDTSRFGTTYDAQRYYRDGPQYSERRLTDADEVYRGSDGRYYCKRSDGTTGLIVGAAAGGLLGNIADGGHNRVAGTLIGGALGALLGRSVEQNSDIRCH